MTKTTIIHNVPSDKLQSVLNDFKDEGYNTSYYLEPDGEFTVIGTKEVPDSSASSAPAAAKASKPGK